MHKKLIQTAQAFAILPLFAVANPGAIISGLVVASATAPQFQVVDVSADAALEAARLDHAAKIDAYYGKYDLPLEGYGMKMVLAAEENDLDWRLLPAIAMRESTGGKFACYNNPFGWGSCKIKFKSFDEAIATVAANLGGSNPNTDEYYKDKPTEQKLHHYNGTVVKTYVADVVRIMSKISPEE